MMIIFVFLSSAKEVVENPPITFGSSYSHVYPSSEADCNSVQSLESKLSAQSGLTQDAVKRFVKKMSFSTSNSVMEKSFEMDINPYKTEQRTAVAYSRVVVCTKTGSNYHLVMKGAKVNLPVYSQVITTTSKKFLFWEYDKQITIQWRPLTSTELSRVYNTAQDKMVLLEGLIK